MCKYPSIFSDSESSVVVLLGCSVIFFQKEKAETNKITPVAKRGKAVRQKDEGSYRSPSLSKKVAHTNLFTLFSLQLHTPTTCGPFYQMAYPLPTTAQHNFLFFLFSLNNDTMQERVH